MVLRPRHGAIAALLFLLGPAACSSSDTASDDPDAAAESLPPGAVCGPARTCAVGFCDDGYCSGGGCKVSGDCSAGYDCVTSSGASDPISAILGTGGESSSQCLPLCGHCPGNMHCPKAHVREDERADLCGPGFEILVTDEGEKVQGSAHVLTATAEGHQLSNCQWRGSTETTTSVTLTLDEERSVVTVLCTDEEARTGGGEIAIVLGCVPAGAICEFPRKEIPGSSNGVFRHCCQPGLSCFVDTPSPGFGECQPTP